jgi:hypothetical protein
LMTAARTCINFKYNHKSQDGNWCTTNELVSLLQCLLQIKLYLQPLFDAQYILFFTTIIQTVFIGFGINGFFELNLFGS